MSANTSNNNSVNSDNNFEQELQNYIQHMQKELNLAEQLIQALATQGETEAQEKAEASAILRSLGLETLVTQLSPGQTGVATTIWKPLTGKTFYWVKKYSQTKIDSIMKNLENCPFVSEIAQSYFSHENVAKAAEDQIDSIETQLKAIDPNITGTLQTLNQLIQESESILSEGGFYQDDMQLVMNQMDQMIHQFCQVVVDKIQIDLAQAAEKKFGSDPNHASAVLEFAAIAIKAEFSEQNTLQGMQDEVIDENSGWQAQKSQAEADLKTAHWYDFFTGGGPDVGKDDAIIRTANAMMGFLSFVEKLISPLIQTIDPGMQEFKIELDQLKKEFKKFLNGHGTVMQLKDAMIAALSIMVGIIAETAKDASMFDAEMSKGNQASAQMHISDSLAQEEVIIDAEKYAKVMGTLMKAVQYVGMAIIFLLNPTAAMALMVVLDAVLNATGVMDKMQNAIAEKTGSTWAAVLTGLTEAVGTAGGAALIEGVVTKLAIQVAIKASEAAVETVVQTVIETGVKTALESAGKVGVDEAEEAAQQVISQTVKEAIETAQKKVADAFLKKTIPQLLASLFKGDLKVAMEVAQKEAAESAAKQIDVLAETAAKQESASVIGAAEMTSIATKGADEGTAKAMQITEKSAAKMGTESALTKFGKRAGWMFIASAGSTGLPAETVAAMEKKNKKDLSEEWQIALGIVNTLLQLIGMLGSSGAGAEMLQSPGIMSKGLLGLNTLNGAAGAVSAAGEADADFEQAGAIKGIAKDQGTLEMMQFLMEQLQKDGALQRDQYSKEMAQASRTNLQLSKHFNDSNVALAEAMAASAV